MDHKYNLLLCSLSNSLVILFTIRLYNCTHHHLAYNLLLCTLATAYKGVNILIFSFKLQRNKLNNECSSACTGTHRNTIYNNMTARLVLTRIIRYMLAINIFPHQRFLLVEMLQNKYNC